MKSVFSFLLIATLAFTGTEAFARINCDLNPDAPICNPPPPPPPPPISYNNVSLFGEYYVELPPHFPFSPVNFGCVKNNEGEGYYINLSADEKSVGYTNGYTTLTTSAQLINPYGQVFPIYSQLVVRWTASGEISRTEALVEATAMRGAFPAVDGNYTMIIKLHAPGYSDTLIARSFYIHHQNNNDCQ